MANSEERNTSKPKSVGANERRDHDIVTDPVRGQERSDWDRGHGLPDYNQGYGPGYEPAYPGGREPLEYDRFRESRENTWPIPRNITGETETGKHSGRGPASYNRPDNRIREDICERLMHHPEIDATEIDVTVLNGEVTLSGTAPDRTTKYAAEDVVYEASGVKQVYNRLRIETR